MKRIIFLLLFFSVSILYTQAHSSKGTEFWCGFMENLDSNLNDCPKFSFIIHAENKTNGQINMSHGNLNFNFQLEPYETKEIFMPYNPDCNFTQNSIFYYPVGSENIDSFGIKITTDNPVTVYAMHYRQFFTESSLILPVSELGTQYFVLAVRDYEQRTQPSEMLILSAKDNNEIKITPSVTTAKLKPAGTPFSIILNAGQVYQIQSQNGDDLSGTLVQSENDKKIALFAGAKQGMTYNDQLSWAANHLWDENYAVNNWGNIFAIVPFLHVLNDTDKTFKPIYGDLIKIISSENNTIVKFDCSDTLILNCGETAEKLILSPTIITSNNLISVAQMNKQGTLNASRTGDPSFMILPPMNYQAKQRSFRSSNEKNFENSFYTTTHFVNIVAKTAELYQLKLDSISIETKFKPFLNNSGYSYAQIPIDTGNHSIVSAGGFSAFAYGFGFYDAYAYHLGYDYVDEGYIFGMSMPDTNGKAGTTDFLIPVKVDIKPEYLPANVKNLRIYIHLNPSVYFPAGATNGIFSKNVVGNICLISIDLGNVTIDSPHQVLTELKGNLFSGNERFTVLGFDSVMWEGNKFLYTSFCSNDIYNRPGSLKIDRPEYIPKIVTTKLPDTSAVIGTKDFHIPLQMKFASNFYYDNLTYNAEINFDSRYFAPEYVSKGNLTGNEIENGDRIINIEDIINYSQTEEILLTEICGTVLLGGKDAIPLRITKFELNDTSIKINNFNGNLNVYGVCKPELDYILPLTNTKLEITPNPAGDEAEIRIITEEQGKFTIIIYSTEGIMLDSKEFYLIDKGDQLGTRSKSDENNPNSLSENPGFKLNLKGYSTGLYQIILKSPNKIVTGQIMVIR